MAPSADVVVIGGGLAGLVTTLELLEHGRDVLLLDRCRPEEVGGLAREAFGGMFMVDTPEQRRSGIQDSRRARARRLACGWRTSSRATCGRGAGPSSTSARARDDVGGWLKTLGVRFFPVVNWAERGVYGDGNSVPRFHLTWGCGQGAGRRRLGRDRAPPAPRSALEVRFEHAVTGLLEDGADHGRGASSDGRRSRAGASGDRGRRHRRQPRHRAQVLADEPRAARRRTS